MRSSGLHDPCRARSDSTGCWCDIAFAGPASGAPRPRAAAAGALDTRAERRSTRSPRLGSSGSIGARTAAKCWSPSALRVGHAGLKVCQPEASRATWSRSSAAAASPLITISEARGPGASSGSKGAVPPIAVFSPGVAHAASAAGRAQANCRIASSRFVAKGADSRTVPLAGLAALRARLRGDRAAGRHPQQRERG